MTRYLYRCADAALCATRWLLQRHGFTGLFVVIVGALWLIQGLGAALVVGLAPAIIDNFGERILIAVSFAQVPAGAWMVYRACSTRRSIDVALVSTAVLLAIRVFADFSAWVAVIAPRAFARDGFVDTAHTVAGLTGAALLHTLALHVALMFAALLVARWPDPPHVDPDELEDVSG